jgi:hypothetical protein
MQEQASHLQIQAPQFVKKKNCDITGVDRETVRPTRKTQNWEENGATKTL